MAKYNSWHSVISSVLSLANAWSEQQLSTAYTFHAHIIVLEFGHKKTVNVQDCATGH